MVVLERFIAWLSLIAYNKEAYMSMAKSAFLSPFYEAFTTCYRYTFLVQQYDHILRPQPA
jgi:hypothetical protein